MAHNLEVGTILYSSWGYDQTNVDFYKVIRRTPHTIDMVGVGHDTVLDNGPYTEVTADPAREFGEVIKGKRVSKGDYPSIRLNSFSRAYPWDGKPKYETGYGFGH